MSNVPFATARLEGHEVVLTIGDEQIRYDNSLNGYQSAHAIVERVNELHAREEPTIDEAHAMALVEHAERAGLATVDDEPPTKVEGQRRSNPPPGRPLFDDPNTNAPLTTPTGEKPAA